MNDQQSMAQSGPGEFNIQALLAHEIFAIAAQRVLTKSEVAIYLAVKAQIDTAEQRERLEQEQFDRHLLEEGEWLG